MITIEGMRYDGQERLPYPKRVWPVYRALSFLVQDVFSGGKIVICDMDFIETRADLLEKREVVVYRGPGSEMQLLFRFAVLARSGNFIVSEALFVTYVLTPEEKKLCAMSGLPLLDIAAALELHAEGLCTVGQALELGKK